MTVDHLVVRRLAYIRYLYEEGVIEAQRPHPLSAKAVSTLHDAAEHLLGLVAEHVKINPPKKSDFMEYWGFLRPGLPAGQELPSKKAMERMNRIRVLHKHHGTIPSQDDIDQIRADVSTFLTDATSLVFGLEFAAVDLADLVTSAVAKRQLQKAHELARSGEHVEALAHLFAAFEHLLADYRGRKKSDSSSGPFDFGPQLSSFDRVPRELRPLDKVTDVAKGLQKAVRIIAYGIDYQRYARFSPLTPYVNLGKDGSIARYAYTAAHEEFGDEEYRFCREFVIQSALRLAQLDYDINLWQRNSDLGATNTWK